MSKETGGAAFPSPGVLMDDGRGGEYQQGAYEGMTLRDYFAAKVLQSFIASGELMQMSNKIVESTDLKRGEWMAQQSYLFADAMLAERAK